ncbi:CAP domain-containing protein [Amycolatopsis sp. cmx-4-61]|uniref:CAP domain-containing protein n=1 Tax=Amycolatopsis sp. cmx-4-61 TaxID=2790937 RepID=UPI00397CA9A9
MVAVVVVAGLVGLYFIMREDTEETGYALPTATGTSTMTTAPTSSFSDPTTTEPTTPPPTTGTTTTAAPVKPAPVPKQPQPPPSDASDATDATAENKVFELTNGERAAHGCPPLAADRRLGNSAREHSSDMADHNYFSHTSLDGRDFVAREKAAGYPTPGAENIAAGQRTADDVVKGWMASPGHRANILNCGLKALGVGMARGGSYGIYWTQNFGR